MHDATGDTPSELHTRPSLLRRVRDSADAESWGTFVQVYAPLVYGYARKRGLQDADASDVAQEVLSELARSMRSFEYQPERGRFRDWLGTLTRRRLARFFNRNITQPLNEELADTPDAEWSSEFQDHLVRVAMTRIEPHFEPKNWQAFLKTWMDRQTASDVAAELGMTPALVYVAKSRGLQRLREELLILAEDVPQLVPLG